MVSADPLTTVIVDSLADSRLRESAIKCREWNGCFALMRGWFHELCHGQMAHTMRSAFAGLRGNLNQYKGRVNLNLACDVVGTKNANLRHQATTKGGHNRSRAQEDKINYQSLKQSEKNQH